MSNKTVGRQGEDAACSYLKKKGFKILERNYKCLFGEIDIIAEYGGVIVITEVKCRSSAKFGAGFEAVSRTKRQKIIKTTEFYIKEKNIDSSVRFDVISIDSGVITHIENAFGI